LARSETRKLWELVVGKLESPSGKGRGRELGGGKPWPKKMRKQTLKERGRRMQLNHGHKSFGRVMADTRMGRTAKPKKKGGVALILKKMLRGWWGEKKRTWVPKKRALKQETCSGAKTGEKTSGRRQESQRGRSGRNTQKRRKAFIWGGPKGIKNLGSEKHIEKRTPENLTTCLGGVVRGTEGVQEPSKRERGRVSVRRSEKRERAVKREKDE